MTILTMLQNVMIESGWGSPPTSVIGNTDTTVVQLKLIAEKVGRDARRSWPWAVLAREYQNAFVSGTASYRLPQDFDVSHYATFWNTDDNSTVAGPVTRQQWAYNKGTISTPIDPVYTLSIPIHQVWLPTIYIDPTPGAGEDGQVFSFWYQSANCVMPTSWTNGASIIAGQYCSYQCRIFLATSSGTTSGTTPLNDVGVTWSERRYSAGEGVTYNFPYLYDTFLADTDRSVFSEDLMERGIAAYFKRIKRFEGWEQDLADFQTALAQSHGGQMQAPVIDMTGRDRRPWPNVPNTSEA